MNRKLALVAIIATTLVASFAAADVRELVGQPAPEIRARALDSDAVVELDRYRGRVVVLAFFATWCSACHRMAPELEALSRAHERDGLTVLALSHEPRDRIRAREGERVYPIVQCTGRTALRYQATGLPTLVVVDRRGVVRAAYQGAEPDVVHRLRRDVARLLAH